LNIVGTLSDVDEVREVEKVARVFIVEERMMNITRPIEIKQIDIKKDFGQIRKQISLQKHISKVLPLLTVRGLN